MNERQRRRKEKQRRHTQPVRPAWLYPEDPPQPLPAEPLLVRVLRRVFVRPVRGV